MCSVAVAKVEYLQDVGIYLSLLCCSCKDRRQEWSQGLANNLHYFPLSPFPKNHTK